MKIYRIVNMKVTRTNSAGGRVAMGCFSIKRKSEHSDHTYKVYGVLSFRGAFLRDHHIDGKTLAKLLPSWAKAKTIRSLGPKVTAFYAENDKVVTRLHHSGFVVGSDDYADWLETQPDPFRSCREYRQSLGERVW